MSTPTPVNLNDSTPPAPVGKKNVHWQADTNIPRNVSAYTDSIGGAVLKTANYTALASDTGSLLSFQSASALTLTLPSPPPSTTWCCFVQNIGTGGLTINPNGQHIDTSTTSLVRNPNQGCYLSTDGTDYFSERNDGGLYDIVCFYPGAPTATALLGMFVVPDDVPAGVTFLANFANSRGHCRANPTAAYTITINRNSLSAGTVTISTTGVFTFSANAFTAMPGDYFSFFGAATPDATLADLVFVLTGRR